MFSSDAVTVKNAGYRMGAREGGRKVIYVYPREELNAALPSAGTKQQTDSCENVAFREMGLYAELTKEPASACQKKTKTDGFEERGPVL